MILDFFKATKIMFNYEFQLFWKLYNKYRKDQKSNQVFYFSFSPQIFFFQILLNVFVYFLH